MASLIIIISHKRNANSTDRNMTEESERQTSSQCILWGQKTCTFYIAQVSDEIK